MEFDFIQLDLSIDAILIKNFKNEKFEFIIKLDEKEIEEIKIKKAAINFFIAKKDFNTPLGNEFLIQIYTSTKNILTLEANGEEEIRTLFEYIKSIIL